MRRLTTALLGACLLGASAAPVIAEETSPPPWFGGRVEMVEHGFAVTIPEDWMAFDLGADVDRQLKATHARYRGLAGAERSCLSRTVSLAAAEEGLQLLAMESPTSACSVATAQSCVFYARRGEEWPLDDFVQGVHRTMTEGSSMVDVSPSTPIEIQAGPARVIRSTTQNVYDEGSWGPTTAYLVESEGDILTMVCGAPDRPDDDWLPIAESIEMLSEAEAPLITSGDLPRVLPSEVAGVPLAVERGTTLVMTEDDAHELFRRLLYDLGEGFADLRVAHARTADPSAPEQYVIEAIRVDSVSADDLMYQLLRVMRSEMGTPVTPPISEWPSLSVDARTVYWSGEAGDAATWSVMYPTGEVLFFVSGSGGVGMEEVLASLP